MKWVSVKEARLFEQWLNTTIASTTWKDLITFLWKDMATINKAMEELEKSELYKEVWTDIENKAKELVETKCKPEWDKISEEMKPLGERRNELAKEKAEWTWSTKQGEELDALDKQLAEMSEKYQKVTDEANAELNEYKEEKINQAEWAAFLLDEEEYSLIWGYAGF